MSDSKLSNLTRSQVRQIRDVILTGGIIEKNGTIKQSQVDKLQVNEKVKSITEEQLGSERTVRALRTRFATGYIGTGSVVFGNSDEAWGGIGREVNRAEIVEVIDDDDTDGLYLGTIAISDSEADDSILTDRIVIRDRIAPLATMIDGWELQVEFQQQTWFDDDTSSSPDYWYEHDEHGWLPVFDVVYRPMELIGKTTGTHAVDTSAAVPIWTGVSSALLASSGESLTAYNRFAEIASGKWVIIRAFEHGWEAVAAEC